MAEKKLVRSTSNKMVAGVCAGIADYFDIDPTIVRIAFALLLVMNGVGAPIYFVMWFIMPEAPGIAGISVDGNPESGVGLG
jgi:phage shock protein C